MGDPEELISEADFCAHARMIPEGFLVPGRHSDFDHPQHTIVEIAGDHQCGNHDSNAAWYYGTDIVVQPD